MQRASPTGGQPQQQKELFNLPYLMERLAPFGNLMSDELAATATALTARTVAAALERNDVPEVARPSCTGAL
jgi:hypothetical protein